MPKDTSPLHVGARLEALRAARPSTTLCQLIIAVVLTLALVFGATANAAPSRRPDVQSNDATGSGAGVSADGLAPAGSGSFFSPGSVFFSTEVYELGQNDLVASHTALVNYFRQLGPGTLRIGGDTADTSWWTSANEPTPGWANVTVTPADLTQLEGFLVATGWKAILSVDLGHFDAARAANEVQYAQEILGTNLAGIEIGNEPNDYGQPAINTRYSGYSVTNFEQDVAQYASAIRAVDPTVTFYGPDTSSSVWFDILAQGQELGRLPFSGLTEHYYPTQYSVASSVCSATAVPTAQQLLSSSTFSAESSLISNLLSYANGAKLPATVDETNDTSSCDEAGGPETSPVFASAIWALDWSLRAASGGISGIGFHDEFGRCGDYAYSPLCTETASAETTGQVTAQPEYYGLQAASQLEGGYFVPVSLSAGSDSAVTAYATETPTGKITLAVINSDFNDSVDAQVSLPGQGDLSASLLSAPSYSATTGEGFSDVTSSSDVEQNTASGCSQTTASVDLPSISAAIITYTPSATNSLTQNSACSSQTSSVSSQSSAGPGQGPGAPSGTSSSGQPANTSTGQSSSSSTTQLGSSSTGQSASSSTSQSGGSSSQQSTSSPSSGTEQSTSQGGGQGAPQQNLASSESGTKSTASSTGTARSKGSSTKGSAVRITLPDLSRRTVTTARHSKVHAPKKHSKSRRHRRQKSRAHQLRSRSRDAKRSAR